MAEMSTSNTYTDRKFFETLKHFPPVIDGKISVINFLKATMDLITLMERFGKIFAPVKYDMQGNIDKIKKHYVYDEDSCLLELMRNEIARGESGIGADAVLWLNRALHFFEILLREIIISVQANDLNKSTKKMFTVAYEGSVKKYHNWVTQQIFVLISKMAPTLPQVLNSVEADDNVKTTETIFMNYNTKLNLVRSKIDDFFKENNLSD